MALSKDQKRDYRSAFLTGRKARTPAAASLLVATRAILERRLLFALLLACSYLAVGFWIWIARDRVTFFLVLGAFAVVYGGFVLLMTFRARRADSAKSAVSDVQDDPDLRDLCSNPNRSTAPPPASALGPEADRPRRGRTRGNENSIWPRFGHAGNDRDA
jgi:hypothetical protein